MAVTIKDERTEQKKTKKQAKTIKVSTVLISIAVTVALIASFAGGWYANTADQSRVEHQAKSLLSTLKTNEQ